MGKLRSNANLAASICILVVVIITLSWLGYRTYAFANARHEYDAAMGRYATAVKTNQQLCKEYSTDLALAERADSTWKSANPAPPLTSAVAYTEWQRQSRQNASKIGLNPCGVRVAKPIEPSYSLF